jgi:hypothetical protein
MHRVDTVDVWIRDHPDIATAVEEFEIPTVHCSGRLPSGAFTLRG